MRRTQGNLEQRVLDEPLLEAWLQCVREHGVSDRTLPVHGSMLIAIRQCDDVQTVLEVQQKFEKIRNDLLSRRINRGLQWAGVGALIGACYTYMNPFFSESSNQDLLNCVAVVGLLGFVAGMKVEKYCFSSGRAQVLFQQCDRAFSERLSELQSQQNSVFS